MGCLGARHSWSLATQPRAGKIPLGVTESSLIAAQGGEPQIQPPGSDRGTVPLASQLQFILWDSWSPLCIAAGKATWGATVLGRQLPWVGTR